MIYISLFVDPLLFGYNIRFTNILFLKDIHIQYLCLNFKS